MFNKSINICCILVLVGIGMINTTPSAQAQELPVFHIAPDSGYACSSNWAVYVDVTFVIKDLGGNIIHQETLETHPAWWDQTNGEACFGFEPGLVQPGMVVSMTDGTTTKETTVKELSFDSVASDGTASGTGPAGESGYLCLDWGSECQWITVSDFGDWNGSLLGYIPEISDLSDAHIKIADGDGDETVAYYPVPLSPWILVNPEEGVALGLNLPIGAEFTLTISDPPWVETYDAISEEDMWNPGYGFVWFELDLSPEQLHPGVVVSLDGGEVSKGVVIVPLSFDGIDPVSLIASGVGPAEGEGHACLGFPEMEYCEPLVLDAGSWTADFSIYEMDLEQLLDAHVVIWDGDGDAIRANLYVEQPPPQPAITVHPEHGWVGGINWTIDVLVTLTIDDDQYPGNGYIHQESQIAYPAGWDPNVGEVWFDLLSLVDDLQPGIFVSLSDGFDTKMTEIVPLSFDSVNTNDTPGLASGIGPPFGKGHVCLDHYSECLPITVPQDGNWSAYFDWYDPEMDLYDAHIVIWDEDGDETMASLLTETEEPPLPAFTVEPDHGWICSAFWPIGIEVTARIAVDDNPITEPVYLETRTTTPADWDPSVGDVCFEFYELADQVQPGMYVKLTDGFLIKDTWIEPLSFGGIDPLSYLATGMGPDGSEGHVYLETDTGEWFHRPISIIGSDGWSADFSNEVFDLGSLVEAHVVIWDGDGDETMAHLFLEEPLPLPYFRLNLTKGLIRALAWPMGDILTIEIDDPATSDPVDYSSSGTVDGYAPWDPGLTMLEFDPGDFEILPGFLIKVYDNELTKVHTVTGLTIDAVDDDLNTATGSTSPITPVDILVIGAQTEFITVESGTNGIWTAYFSIDLLGDELFLIMEWDEDGDSTEVRWFPNNPPIGVDDSYSLDEDTVFSEFTTGVLANDSDPDGDDLAMVLVNGVTYGDLVYNTDGTFTYTPQENFFGTDSFSYKAVDGELESNEVLVMITVDPVNDIPVVTLPSAFSINEGQTFLGSGSFSDPDPDGWTGIVDYGDGSALQTLSLTTQQSFDLAHDYLDSGVYTVSVDINDGSAEGSASSEITIYNVAPAVSIDSVAGGESSVLVGLDVSLEGSFFDPGADTHTALIDWGDGTQVVDPALSPLAATHVYQNSGQYTIVLTVTDDDGGTGSASATLTVIEPADAAEDVIEVLDNILTDPELPPEASEAIEDALVDLQGANDGLSNSGALDKIVGGQWNAALTKIKKALQDLEAAEAADPSLDLTELKELLVLAGKSVTLEIIESAEADGSPPAVIDQAYALVSAGQALLDVGDYLGAVGKFLDAIHIF